MNYGSAYQTERIVLFVEHPLPDAGRSNENLSYLRQAVVYRRMVETIKNYDYGNYHSRQAQSVGLQADWRLSQVQAPCARGVSHRAALLRTADDGALHLLRLEDGGTRSDYPQGCKPTKLFLQEPRNFNVTMATYQFNFTVTPSQDGYWIDIRNQKEAISAETLDEAIDKFVEFMEQTHGVTISKTSRKRPQKMYADYKDGSTKEVGRVFSASMEIDMGDYRPIWKRKWCNVWTEVYMMQNMYLKAA